MKKTITVTKAKRIEKIPPYLFAEIDRKKEEMIKRGVDIIDLGKGDPDLPTPPFIVEAMKPAPGSDGRTPRSPAEDSRRPGPAG